MLTNQVRECLRHVEDCMQRAAVETDPKLRRDYLIIGSCWLKLSQELSEMSADFSKPTARAKPKEGMEGGISLAH